MNTNNRENEAAQDDTRVADENVERLLATSYDPETPDQDFVRRVSDRVLEVAGSVGHSQDERAVRPASPISRRLLRWETVPWVIIIVLLVLLVSLPVRQRAPDVPGYYREGDIVWIDGKAYRAADLRERENRSSQNSRPRGGLKPSRAEIRPVGLFGDRGLTPRVRPAIENPPRIEVGKSVTTRRGQRRRVTLPDGSTLYVNENTFLTVDERRSISLKHGQVYLDVVPQNEGSAETGFVVKTSRHAVTALGTKFATEVDGSTTAVLVTQGTVQVGGVDLSIRAGQQLKLETRGEQTEEPVVTAASRASHLLSWTKDLMVAAESPLVPASDHSGGSLIAIDPDGQEMKLSLRKYHVDVHIEDGFARTTIDQTYFNHKTWRLEGKFYFPLPADASISRLAMYVNGRLMEGGMCERDHARNVFETIKHRALDPALLEWVDGSTFKMRVFPLEGRQEKRIVLSYTQRLPNHYGSMQYRFPTGNGKESVHDRSIRIRVARGESVEWRCDSHDFKATTNNSDLILRTDGSDVPLDGDLVVNLKTEESAARFSTFEYGDSRYFMVRYRPELEVKPRVKRRDWIFLFDADGSRDPLLARIQVDVIRTMLKHAEHEDRFAIVTAATRTRSSSPELKPVSADNIADAIKMLDRTHLIGALDLEKALDACHDYCKKAENPTLVHVGGGVPVLGDRRAHTLLTRLPEKTQYVGVAVGKRWNRSFMRSAASQADGYVTQINPDEPVCWRAFDLMSTLNTPRLLDLKFELDDESVEFLTFSDSSVHGEEICAIARLGSDQGLPSEVRVVGRLDGQPFERAIEVEEVDENAGYLPRQWAKLAIDAMVNENAEKHKSKIIALSKSMYVMSPFTSLLVLENDEMYEQYNVDRGRKDHWALYPCPESIEVVHEPISGPQPEPSDADEKETKPSPRAVLQTLLVRRGRFGYGKAVPRRIRGIPLNTPFTGTSVPDGGTMMLGGIRHRANELGLPSLNTLNWTNNLGPTFLFGLNPSGLPSADFDLAFTQEIARTLDGTSSSGEEFIRRVHLDLIGSVPSSSEVEEFLYGFRSGSMASSDIEFDNLIELITTTISPGTWEDVGGSGSIEGFSTNLSLVISQTQSVQDQIASRYWWSDQVDPGTDLLGTVYPVADLVIPVIAGNGKSEWPISMSAGQSPFLYPPPEVWQQLTRDRTKYSSVDLTRAGNALTKIAYALREQTVIEFVETPLADVVDYLEDYHGIQIELDEKALNQSGIAADTPITRHLEGVSLQLALRLILKDLGTAFAIWNDVLVITTPDAILGEERLLPIYTRVGLPAWVSGRDVTRAARLPPANLNDPRLVGLWARILRQRAKLGSRRPNTLYLTPPIGNDKRKFRHLLSYAPGMNTTESDILTVLNRESALSDSQTIGKIEPVARELIDRARSRDWQAVVLSDSGGRELLRLQIDGHGRYRYQRKTEHGLGETVICDGRSLWHLYPELGLGARRDFSRFHGAQLTSLVPWHLQSAKDLAVGADLNMVGPRTVAIVPHHLRDAMDKGGKPVAYARVHLVFAEDGRLAERQLVEMPTGKTIARSTYANDGTVRVLDADGKIQSEIQLKVAESTTPELEPEVEDLVILPMPIRSASHIYRSMKEREAAASRDKRGDVRKQTATLGAFVPSDFVRWRQEDALRLAAANHWEDPQELQDVIAQRFFANGDRRIGFYVLLLSSGLNWDPSEPVQLRKDLSDAFNPLTDHPNSPLARYISSQLMLREHDSRKVAANIKTAEDHFVGQLSEFRRLYMLWARTRTAPKSVERFRRDLDELFAFIHRCNSPTFAFTLLRRVQHHVVDVFSPFSSAFPGQMPHRLDEARLHRRIAEALLRFENQGVTSYVVQYELARSLANCGDKEKARQRFLRLYRETFDQGVLPLIDRAFVEALGTSEDPFLSPFDQAAQPGEEFSDLMLETCQRLINQGNRHKAIALVWQCGQLGLTELAERLLAQTLSGVAPDQSPGTTLAVVEYLVHDGQHKRAVALLQSLLKLEELAGKFELWRLAAEVADQGKLFGRALHFRQRAVELEFRQLDSTVDLRWVRDQYGDLLDRYGKMADIVVRPGSKTSDELARGVVKIADRWRSLDNDPTAACHAAACVLSTLGQYELAWDYLTTPLALKPNEAAPWVDLARSMQDSSQFAMADRAYAAAFEAEPTNAEILWDHASLLNQNGQSARAMQLYSQIAGGQWQPRFASICQQAKAIVGE